MSSAARGARALHDDFGQRLAMLAADLARTEEIVQEPQARKELHKLWSVTGLGIMEPARERAF